MVVPGQSGSVWFSDATAGPEFGTLEPGGQVTQYSLTGFNGYISDLEFAPDQTLWLMVTSIEPQSCVGCPQGGSPKQLYVGRFAPSGAYALFSVDVTGMDNSIFRFFMSPVFGDSVWISDRVASQLIRIGVGGGEDVFQLPPSDHPSRVTVGSDGSAWFMTPTGFGHLTSTGDFYVVSLDVANNGFAGSTGDLAFASDGSLWVTVTECMAHTYDPAKLCWYGESKGELEQWATDGRWLQTITMAMEPTVVTAGDDGSIWFAGSRQFDDYYPVPMLGRLHGGSLLFSSYLNQAFQPGNLVTIGGTVWYGESAVIDQFTP